MKSSKEALKAFCEYYWKYPSLITNAHHLSRLKEHVLSLDEIISIMGTESKNYNSGEYNMRVPPPHQIISSDIVELATILYNQFK